jgi:hypothetical protein
MAIASSSCSGEPKGWVLSSSWPPGSIVTTPAADNAPAAARCVSSAETGRERSSASKTSHSSSAPIRMAVEGRNAARAVALVSDSAWQMITVLPD